MSVSLDFAYFFVYGLFKDPKGSHKKNLDRERHFQGTQVPPNIARFCTNKCLTLSLKNSKSIFWLL